MDDISYDDFSKLDLRVAKFVSTEKFLKNQELSKVQFLWEMKNVM